MTTEKTQLQNGQNISAGNGPAVVLHAEDISHSYDGRSHSLQGVNVELREGRFTMMLGRSASGKTTLVKIIAGIIKPERGRIRLEDEKNGAARRVAYIPQNLGLVRNLTALENVLTGALGYTGTMRSMINGFGRDVRERAGQILADLGIADKAGRKIWYLSGGERQRVAIARALIQNPRIILADEFVSQLDPVTSMEILGIMKKLAQNKITFLITTHDVALAQKYADRVIIIKDGRIVRERAGADLSSEDVMKDLE